MNGERAGVLRSGR